MAKPRRTGLDERNLVRLNPILGLNRVNPDFTSWTRTLDVPGLGLVQFSCEASHGHTVPHGIDADVLVALTSAYEMQGRPNSRAIYISFADICHIVGLAPGLQTYSRIRESLDRLYKTNLTFSESWIIQNQGQEVGTDAQFRILQTLVMVNQESVEHISGRFHPLQLIKVRISEEIAESIENDYTHAIDLGFYGKMTRPLTRLLYRILENERKTGSGESLTTNLMAWGARLGLVERIPQQATEIRPIENEPIKKSKPSLDDNLFEVRVIRSNRLQRALEPAHKELIGLGYLLDVEQTGRGQNQVLKYRFGSIVEAIETTRDTEENIAISEKLLLERGITTGRARYFSQKFMRKDIEHVIRKFDDRIKSGYAPRNRSGFLISMLTEPDNYVQLNDVTSIDTTVVSSTKKDKKPSGEEYIPQSLERSPKSAEIALGRLFDAAQDQALKETLVAAYVAGQISTLQLAELTRLELAEARRRALDLLDGSTKKPTV